LCPERVFMMLLENGIKMAMVTWEWNVLGYCVGRSTGIAPSLLFDCGVYFALPVYVKIHMSSNSVEVAKQFGQGHFGRDSRLI